MSRRRARHLHDTGGVRLRRRALLRGALGGLAASALPFATGVSAEPLSRTRVTERLIVLAGAGGNVLVLTGDEGLVLVDSGAAQHADALLAALAELPGGGRIETLFNTHWHLDQVGANEILGSGGARIVAHEKTRARLSTPFYLADEDRYRPALPPAARPTQSFHTSTETAAAGERIELGYLLQAHTDGDIYVYFRESNVLAVGDAVSPLRDPELDWFGGGWLGGRVDALERLLAISDAETRFVPSYGPVVGRAEVQAEHDLLLAVFERMHSLIRQGYTAEDMLAEGIMDGLGRSFDDPLKFLRDAHKSLWAHHNTLSHDIV